MPVPTSATVAPEIAQMPELEGSAENATARPEPALAETTYVAMPTTALAGGVEVKTIVCRAGPGDGVGAGTTGGLGLTPGRGACDERGVCGEGTGGSGRITIEVLGGCAGDAVTCCDGARVSPALSARESSCVTSDPLADAGRKRNRSFDSSCCVGVNPSASAAACTEASDVRPLESSMPSSALCSEIATL